jgi:hypothetical protein
MESAANRLQELQRQADALMHFELTKVLVRTKEKEVPEPT